METKKNTHNYVEWISAEEMHDATLQWFSELSFVRDEQQFLNNLVKSFTLQLTSSKIFQESKLLINDLLKAENDMLPLMKKVQMHENQLEIMLDDVDQIKMEKAYVETHKDLLVAMDQYLIDYRRIKEKLFKIVSQVMKKEKQTRLLH